MRELAAQQVRIECVRGYLKSDDRFSLDLESLRWELKQVDAGRLPGHAARQAHLSAYEAAMARFRKEAQAALQRGQLSIGINHLDGPNPTRKTPGRQGRSERNSGRDR